MQSFSALTKLNQRSRHLIFDGYISLNYSSCRLIKHVKTLIKKDMLIRYSGLKWKSQTYKHITGTIP